jgi:hypothetical protein
VFVIVLPLTTSQQPHPQEQQRVAGDQHRQTAKGVPTQAVVDTPKPTHSRPVQQNNPTGKTIQARDNTPWFSWKSDIGLQDVFGLLTLLVTAVFLYYTIKTWKQMVRANDHAEKANEESSRETQESLALTRQSNEVTARSVDVTEKQVAAIVRFARAQITLAGILPPNEILPQGQPPETVMVPLINAGNTPAINVKWWGRSGITPKGVPIDWQFGTNRTESDAAETTIGAGQSIRAIIEIRLSNEEMGAVVDASAELRIHGRVQYRDIFSDHVRATEFESGFVPYPYAHWAVLRQTEE